MKVQKNNSQLRLLLTLGLVLLSYGLWLFDLLSLRLPRSKNRWLLQKLSELKEGCWLKGYFHTFQVTRYRPLKDPVNVANFFANPYPSDTRGHWHHFSTLQFLGQWKTRKQRSLKFIRNFFVLFCLDKVLLNFSLEGVSWTSTIHSIVCFNDSVLELGFWKTKLNVL